MAVPDHAAVSLAMADITADRVAVRYKALANAVLRRIARERDALLASVDARLDTPGWLFERWTRVYGEAAALRIAEANHVEPPLDLSVKSGATAWAERLRGVVLPTGTVRTVPSGPVEAMPGYADGAWWVRAALVPASRRCAPTRIFRPRAAPAADHDARQRGRQWTPEARLAVPPARCLRLPAVVVADVLIAPEEAGPARRAGTPPRRRRIPTSLS
jgi:hypothetical protein